MFACFCLNIQIETGLNSDFQKVTAESLNLSEKEKNDDFFKQEILRVGRLLTISKVHSSLVQSRNLDSWTVSRCANCECNSHAVHREYGASFVLIYKNLLDSQAIADLKISDAYSPIYKIVVNPHSDATDVINFGSLQIREVESSIRDFKVIMTDFIRKETLEVANKLKKFKKQLYKDYDEKMERARKENEHLATLVQISYNQIKPESSPGQVASAALSPPRLDRLADEALPNQFGLLLANRALASPLSDMRRKPRSIDAEGVFDFEGTDEAPSLSSSDHNDTDGEGVKDPEEFFIPRPIQQKEPRREVAQSLPVDIPTFMESRHRSAEDLEEIPQGENVNIHESIRALAQSVHGDAVFGDLPKPRINDDQ